MLAYRISCITKGAWRREELARGDENGGWLSVQYVISCVRDANEKGCEGASVLENVILHLTEKHRNGEGLFFDSIYPYIEGSNGEESEGASCKPVKGEPRFNYESYYSVSNGKAPATEEGLIENINRIKKEIMEHGPVVTSMYVYDSFMSINKENNTPETPYTVEPYRGKFIGGHAVMLIGWGTIPGFDVQNSTSSYKNQYWILRNSWGPGWGHNGYWYWKMGDDFDRMKDGETIMIEYMAVAGVPHVNNYVKTLLSGSLLGGKTGKKDSGYILIG